MLDLDPQQSAARWGDRRGELLPVVLAVPPSRIDAELERVTAAGADVVLIDTPPRAGSDNAALAAARVADLVIVPARPSIVDLEATADTLQRVTVAPRVVAVLCGCAPRGGDADDAAAALAGRAEMCPVRIGQRVAFSRSLLAGRTAQEVEPGGRAADETVRLHTFTVCTR